MLSEDIQTRLATETGQAPSNPNVDNTVIAEKYPALGNALKSAHSSSIQLKTITSVWDSRIIDIIAESIEKACDNSEELAIMIQKIEKLNN